MQHPELTFMQDTAPGHKDSLKCEDLEHFSIITIKWPALSPDLNPI
jgi:hypothetical protein